MNPRPSDVLRILLLAAVVLSLAACRNQPVRTGAQKVGEGIKSAGAAVKDAGSSVKEKVSSGVSKLEHPQRKAMRERYEDQGAAAQNRRSSQQAGSSSVSRTTGS